MVSCQGEHKPRKRNWWNNSRFSRKFIIAGIAIGGVGQAPFSLLASPMLFIHKILNKIFINMCSNNTLLNADKD